MRRVGGGEMKLQETRFATNKENQTDELVLGYYFLSSLTIRVCDIKSKWSTTRIVVLAA